MPIAAVYMDRYEYIVLHTFLIHATCPSPCCMPMSMLQSMSMLGVQCPCPYCICGVLFPCCMPMSLLHVMSMLHVHVHAACPSTSFVPMPMLQARVYPACLYPCCMNMNIQHGHGLVARTWTCSMDVDSSTDLDMNHRHGHIA